jgi:type IV pilus assembly protein PilW
MNIIPSIIPPSSSLRMKQSFRSSGYTLIELMIAMLLGVMILIGVIALFQSNRQVSAASESLGNVQDATRTAFSMMARDIRLAGNSPCGSPPVNTVQMVSTAQTDASNVSRILTTSSLWWLNWNSPVKGYTGTTTSPFVAFGTAPGQRTAGTDAISLVGTDPNTGVPIIGTSNSVKMLTVPAGTANFVAGDVVMACSPVQGSIFMVTSTQASFTTSGGSTGTGISFATGCGTGGLCTCSSYLGGNSTVGCGNAVNGGDAGQNIYTYTNGSSIAILTPTAWYIGGNSAGTSSLWRVVYVRNSVGKLVPQPQEIVRGATALSFSYQIGATGGGWVAPGAVTDWASVVAVRATLTVSSGKALQSGLGPTLVTRTFTTVTTIRNKAL